VAPAVPARAAAVIDKAMLKEHYEAESEKVFKPIRAFFGKQGLDARFVAKVGPAAENIASLAKQGRFDLVVLGSHGHGTLGNLVLGSVATRLLASCQTPALLVR
jgi:nucleotide-binding universal stress UspA family protein